MDHETNGGIVSPLPPPPPPTQQQSISIREILNDYYEGGSFSSGMNNADAMNIADSVMAEIDQISPPKEEHGEDSPRNHFKARRNDLPEILRGAAKNLDVSKMKNGNALPKAEKAKSGSTCIAVSASPSKALGIQSNPSQHIAPQLAEYMSLDQKSSKSYLNDEEDLSKKRREGACLAIGKNHHDAVTESAPKLHVAERISNSPSISNDSKKIKKRFLRKGARKEPSALHRSSCVGNGNKHEPKPLSDESDKAKKLEELERMQEKQVEDLQKRIQRRQQAREEIHNRGCTVQVMEHKGDKKCDRSLEEAQECQQLLQASDSSSSDDGSLCSASSEESDNISDDLSLRSKDEKVQESRPKLGGHKRQLKVPQKRQCNDKNTNMRSPFKPVNNKKINRTPSSDKDLRTPEMEEQWQLMKSMRRRQEAALRAAEKEREETKAWAASEKDKVNKWKDQQRSLILKERQRIMNSAMASQRKKRHEKLEEQAAEAVQFSRKRAREEIESLTESLNKQKIEADAAKARHRLSEKRWKDMNSERDKRIQELREEVECINEKNKKVKQEKSELIIKLEEIMTEKKKRKKKSKGSSKKKEVEIIGNDTAAGNEDHSQDQESNRNEATCRHDCAHNMTYNHGAAEKACTLLQPDRQPSHDRECKGVEELDNNVVQIISSNQDLIEKPTEDWLRPHLNSINVGDSQNEDNVELERCYLTKAVDTATPKSVYYTPLKERPYDPLKYTDMEESKDRKVSTQASVPSTGRMNKAHEHRHANGTRVVTYQNGTVKENLPDGTTMMRFANGDVKTSYGNIGITVYYYSESKTSHTAHPDGTEVFEFESGQSEKHFPDGSKQVQFPDGTKQTFYANGGSETLYADGVKVQDEVAGRTQILEF